MGSLVPVIVVIYLVASGQCWLESTKTTAQNHAQNNKGTAGPQRPRRRLGCWRPAAVGLNKLRLLLQPIVSTAPTVKSSTLSQHRGRNGVWQRFDYGFDSFADWEDEADVDLTRIR